MSIAGLTTWRIIPRIVSGACKHGLSLYGDGSKPCTPGEPQNSWDLWMFIPLKMVLIGIDPYPYNDLQIESSTECGLRITGSPGFFLSVG